MQVSWFRRVMSYIPTSGLYKLGTDVALAQRFLVHWASRWCKKVMQDSMWNNSVRFSYTLPIANRWGHFDTKPLQTGYGCLRRNSSE